MYPAVGGMQVYWEYMCMETRLHGYFLLFGMPVIEGPHTFKPGVFLTVVSVGDEISPYETKILLLIMKG